MIFFAKLWPPLNYLKEVKYRKPKFSTKKRTKKTPKTPQNDQKWPKINCFSVMYLSIYIYFYICMCVCLYVCMHACMLHRKKVGSPKYPSQSCSAKPRFPACLSRDLDWMTSSWGLSIGYRHLAAIKWTGRGQQSHQRLGRHMTWLWLCCWVTFKNVVLTIVHICIVEMK